MGIIIKPLVTEKMTAITDKTNNRFGFIVRPEANKLEIKKEVEALYNVTVVDVNTMKYAGKNRKIIIRMIDDGARERNLPGTVLVVPRCRTMPSPVPGTSLLLNSCERGIGTR